MPLKIALISHYIDAFTLQQRTLTDKDAVPLAITAQVGARLQSVQASTNEALKNKGQLVIHSLWTVYGWNSDHDTWAKSTSQSCTLILERMYAPNKEQELREVLVYSNGRLVSAPIHQHFATADDLKNIPLPLGFINEMMTTPTPTQAGRIVPLPDNKKGLLVVCGEINFLDYKGGTCTIHPAPLGPGLPRFRIHNDDIDVVINPTHTPMFPQPIREKRSWLSMMVRGKSCVAVANTYPATAQSKGRHVGIETYCAGVRKSFPCTVNPYTIEYYTIP